MRAIKKSLIAAVGLFLAVFLAGYFGGMRVDAASYEQIAFGQNVSFKYSEAVNSKTWQFTIDHTQRIRFDMNTPGSLTPHLRVEYDDPSGSSSRICVTDVFSTNTWAVTLNPNTYYVTLYTDNPYLYGSSTQLRVTEVSGDYTALSGGTNFDNAVTVSPGNTIKGLLTMTPIDQYYKLVIPENSKLELNYEHDTTMDLNPTLIFYDANQILQFEKSGSTGVKDLWLDAGTYFLVVHKFDGSSNAYRATGNYSFTLTAEKTRLRTQTKSIGFGDALNISVGEGVNGLLTRADTVDYYRFSVPSNEQITISGTQSDYIDLFIYGSDQQTVVFKHTTVNSRNFSYQVSLEAGTYYIEVSKAGAVQYSDGVYYTLILLQPSVFTDVPSSNAELTAACGWGTSTGVVAGTSATTFSPNDPVTRGQFVTFLWRRAGQPEVSDATNFTDVVPGSYYEKAVKWGAKNGIVAGTSPTTFSPGDHVTKGQAITFLWRYEGQPTVSSTAPFTDLGNNYWTQALNWASANGVATGSGTFGVGTDASRADSVLYIYRAEKDK